MNGILVLLLSFVLAAFLVLKEVRRSNRSWLFLRISASLAAVAALAGLPFTVLSPFSTSRPVKTAVLITAGTIADSLSRVKNLPLFYVDPPGSDLAANAPVIADLGHFLETSGFTKFELIGTGVDADELPLLTGKPVVFHPSPLSAGITAVDWSRSLHLGQPLIIRGNFHAPNRKPVKILLKGLETTLDSLVCPPGADLPFILRTFPKVTGKALFNVIALSGIDTLENEVIPVEIRPAPKIKVLIVQESPDFENKFLKNWLAEQGFAVAMRTTISKGKFGTELLNTPNTTLQPLTRELLSRYDLLVSSRIALNALDKGEADAVKMAVSNGMGLLIKTDSLEKQSAAIPGNVELYQLHNTTDEVIHILLAEKKLPLPLTQPVFIRPQPASQEVIHDEKNRVLVMTRLSGKGKITVSALPETYPLQLSGNTGDYSALWSLILEKTLRKSDQEEEWSLLFPFGRINERQEIVVRQTSSLVPQITQDGIPLPPAENPVKAFEWQVNSWPLRAGWQTVKKTGGSSFSWYSYGEDSWKTLRAAERLRLNQQLVRSSKERITAATEEKSRQPISKVWFLLLFFACCGFLWAEPKFL